MTAYSEPNPAIVAQDAVRRLPHWALVLVCVAYILPGTIGRDPWKNADIAAFGVMFTLPSATTWGAWLHPTLMGQPAEMAGALPYWLGAWAIELAPAWVAPDFAARIPFMLLLAGVFVATWHATRHLASLPGAQPVAFAFGGEAQPVDYARTLADGAVLALVATLGLAQFSHETTPAVAQLFCVALAFYGLAAWRTRPRLAPAVLLLGLIGLTLSGAPLTALFYGAVASATALVGARATPPDRAGAEQGDTGQRRRAALLALGATLACLALVASGAVTIRWERLQWRGFDSNWRPVGQLLLWFIWPAWVFTIWTLWRWRRQLLRPHQHPHLALPLLILSAPLAAAVLTSAGDRALLLALPALAALSAFALPTFKRTAAALIDWFTILFFSAAAIIIWVVWISLQTGFPKRPAYVIARAAPQFEPVFVPWALAAALLGTAGWLALARWRTARHRPALWKSLVLPAAGATLCWMLLTTLWLPALNYARSYAPQFDAVRQVIGAAPCVEVQALSQAQIAAVIYHGGWTPRPFAGTQACPWLISGAREADSSPFARVDARDWQLVTRVQRPAHRTEALAIYQRKVAR